MHPEVREKLEALNAALEAPAAPASLYDVDTIAALIARFHRAHQLNHVLTEMYASALIRALAAKETGIAGQADIHTEFVP